MYGQGLGRSSLSTLSVLLVEVWRNDYDYLPKGGEGRGGERGVQAISLFGASGQQRAKMVVGGGCQ